MSKRFLASSQVPKAWVFHLFKVMDIDSLPTLSSEISRCIHLWSAFTSAHKQKLKSLRLGKGEAAWLGSTCCEHQNVAEIFFSGYTTFTGGSCINLTWYTILLNFVILETLDYQLVRPRESTGISWQSSSGLWLLIKHCSAPAATEQQTWQTLSRQMILCVLLYQEAFTPCLLQTRNAPRSQAWTAWIAGGMISIRLRKTISVRARRWS